MGDLCPLDCVRIGCPEPDFLEKHGAWLLTMIAGISGGIGMLLTYFLKSRCSTIKCCGANCTREVIDLKPTSVEITSSNP